MIFTVGRTAGYEQYIDNPGGAKKGIGGSVWRFYKGAYCYLEATNQLGEYTVYAVDADWFKDTEEVKGSDDSIRSLTKEAKIYRVLRHISLPNISSK
jgi:hypothetical protein